MNKILYVGNSGFPIGFAQVQRQFLIAKGLVEHNCDVIILSRFGVHESDISGQISEVGVIEGINYKFCSGSPYRPSGFITRNIYKIKGVWNEFLEIKNSKADAMIITCNLFSGIVHYCLLARLFGISSVIDQVEYWSSHKNKGLIKKIDSLFNDNLYFYFAKRVVVISEYLENIVKKGSFNKQVLKIPAICDFDKIDELANTSYPSESPYLLFCGAATYIDVIIFIIDSFSRLNTNIELVLIVNGQNSYIEKIKNYIKKGKIGNIHVRSKVPYKDLISYYKNSFALLIPLRPTKQDIGRFPHKLGEYTASGRPIISTEIGEIGKYFTNGVDAILAKNYKVEEFSQAIKTTIENPELAEKIATNSKQLGHYLFDYRKNTKLLYNFLFSY
ncbi:glycosyltransferase [Bacteroidota bacterium]